MIASSLGITFSSTIEAEQFRRNNSTLISLLIQRVKEMPGVDRAEVRLNEFEPSFIAGYDSNNYQIVKIKLTT